MRKVILGTLTMLLASVLSACATNETNNAVDTKEEKQYVTGSNLPKKDRSGVVTISKEALDAAMQNAAAASVPANMR